MVVDVSDHTIKAIAHGITEELNLHTDLAWTLNPSSKPGEWRIYDIPRGAFVICLFETGVVVLAKELIGDYVYENPNLVDDLIECVKKHQTRGGY